MFRVYHFSYIHSKPSESKKPSSKGSLFEEEGDDTDIFATPPEPKVNQYDVKPSAGYMSSFVESFRFNFSSITRMFNLNQDMQFMAVIFFLGLLQYFFGMWPQFFWKLL